MITFVCFVSDYGKSADLNTHIENKFNGCIMLMFANILLSCFMVSYGFYLSSSQTLIYSDINILKQQIKQQILFSVEAEIQMYKQLNTVEEMFKTLLEQCHETAVNKSREVLNDFLGEWRNFYESADKNVPTNKNFVFKSFENPFQQINQSQLTATMQHTLKNLSYELQDYVVSNESENTSFNPADNEQISDEIEDFTNTPNFAIPINNFNIDGDTNLRPEDPSHLRRPKRSNRRGKEPERRPSNGGGVRQRKKKQLRGTITLFKG